MRRETVDTYSLLYEWRGTEAGLEPILLSGHLDVVPVEPGTERSWEHDPFGGHIAGAFVWGRGAIDDKSTVVGALEAIEFLLAEGFQPVRTIYLAFGHDEEVGGTAGAARIAALLKSRNAQLEMVVDEGGVIADGVLAGVPRPVALVGIAEKGFVTIELSTRVAGGHSSLPPRNTAVGVLSAAVARLEQTILQAGTKDNVLPSTARALVNYRIFPGDTIAGVVKHVTQTISDARVDVRVAGRFSAEPSAISPTDSEGFRMLERSIRRVFPEAVVAPYLVVVATDARHYADLSPNVLRFLPLRLTPARDG